MPQGESAGKLTKRVREAIESAYGLQLAQLTQILVENDLESPTISTKADVFELAQLYVSKGPRPLASLLTCLLERRQDHALLKQALEHVDSLSVAPTGPADQGNVASSSVGGSSRVSEFRLRLLTAPNSERELRSLEYEVEAYLNSEPGDYEARLLLDDVRSARGFATPSKSARPRSLRWVLSVAAASLLIATASLTYFQYGNRPPVASPVSGDLTAGLDLENLRPPDEEADQGREERSFAASIRFDGPALTHVVTRTSAGQELVIKEYSLQGTVDGDILAVRDGKYASLETFAKSAEKSFEKGQGLVCPADSRLVLRSLTGDGKLTYKINGYVRSAGDGKPGPKQHIPVSITVDPAFYQTNEVPAGRTLLLTISGLPYTEGVDVTWPAKTAFGTVTPRGLTAEYIGDTDKPVLDIIAVSASSADWTASGELHIKLRPLF